MSFFSKQNVERGKGFRAALCAGLSVLVLQACTQPAQRTTVKNYGTTSGAGSAGVHTVLEGDTVYTISKAYQLPMRDIIMMNDIAAPYQLNLGFRVQLPPPREYRVRRMDTIRDIARMHDTTTRDLAQLNNLSPPYKLRAGQVLRLPTPSAQALVNASITHPENFERTASKAPVSSVEREVLPPQNSSSSPVHNGAKQGGIQPGQKPLNPVSPTTQTTQTTQTSIIPKPGDKPENSASPSQKPKVEQASVTQRAQVKSDVPKRSGNGKFMWPVEGKVISTYGPKADGLHNDGINIKAPKGTPVRAAENGVVMYAGNELEGYGNLILIRHENRWMTAYAHLDKFLVKKGDKVRQGQSVGTVGSTGQVDSSQLHFEIRRGTEALNPKLYM